MTPTKIKLESPVGKAYSYDDLRASIGERYGVPVADEGVEQAEVLAVRPSSTGRDSYDVTMDVSDELARRYEAAEVDIRIDTGPLA